MLLFASDRDGDLEIFRMGVDGSRQAQVTLDTWDEYQPDASAATGWVAFSVASGGIEIVVPGSDTYVLDNVWREGTGFYWPAWSPDGSRIAFDAGSEGISIAAPDGSEERLLVEGGKGFSSPTWAPDGSAIAVIEAGEGFSGALRVLPLDGSAGYEPAATWADVLTSVAADWSPDGASIAYDCTTEDLDPEICVVPAPGGEPVNLSRSPGADFGPEWSPDGSRIAFVSKRDGNAEIYVMNADGSGQVRLTDDPAADVDPAWAVEPASGFGVYATDLFDDPASGWESYGGETSSAGYEQGSLVVRASEPRWLAISAAPLAVPSRSSIRLDARDTGESTDTGFGFVCGYEDIDNHFAAGIGSDGTYAILERRNGETTILTGGGSWAPSDAIEAGAESYRIEGTCGERRIELWVDGKEVVTAWDVDLPESGAFGVFVETFGDGGAEIRFDEIAYSGFPRKVVPSLTRAP